MRFVGLWVSGDFRGSHFRQTFYAIHTVLVNSLPAGVMAAFFLLLCALFLLGLYNGVAAWLLLLLIFASAGLAVGPMTEGYGAYFLPETLWRILSDQWLQNLAALAVWPICSAAASANSGAGWAA